MKEGEENLGDGSEIDVGGGAGAGEGAAGAAAGKGADRMSFKSAFDKVREEAAGAGAGAGGGADDADGDAGAGAAGDEGAGEGEGEGEIDVTRFADETPEEREERLAGMSDGDRAAYEAAEAELIVDIGARRDGEEPIRIQATDKAMADQLRALTARAENRETTLRLREEAEAIRQQADEMQYEVQLDPTGFVTKSLSTSPTGLADAVHMVKFLVTRPGVLNALTGDGKTTLGKYISLLSATPDAIAQEARIADADSIQRRQQAAPRVEQMKRENQNARACVRAAYNAVDEIVPDEWSDQQRGAVVSDVIRDLQELQQSERVRMTDPARVKKLVQDRLTRFGVAPKGEKRSSAGGGKGRAGSKTPTPTSPSGRQLVATDGARRRAAGPGPGAGSPAARIPKPPAGTKLTGKNNVFDHVRKMLPALRRAR